MVNLQADSEKLQNRAVGIIVDLSGCEASQAKDFMHRANGDVKIAVLLASGCKDVQQAANCLSDSFDNLGTALSQLTK